MYVLRDGKAREKTKGQREGARALSPCLREFAMDVPVAVVPATPAKCPTNARAAGERFAAEIREEAQGLDEQELEEFYRGARMVVVPSIWCETFGLVAAEAMSHGVPVVATRLGALQNTVDDEETGLLFDLGNVADLSEKILRLWNDDALCRKLGHAAREKVRDQYNLDAHFNQTMHAYESVLSVRALG